MTSAELRDVFVSDKFKRDLAEMSCYLASIKQERAIIFLLAKFLRECGRVFQLEAKHRDLVVDDTHVEFKYNFDCDMAILDNDLKKYGNQPLEAMWADVHAGTLSDSWSVMPAICKDMCPEKSRRLADVFVWIICSRDLTKVSPETLERICWAKSRQQRKWSEKYPYPDRTFLVIADSLLDKLKAERAFSVIKEEIVTNGDFPSTYHFRICEFSRTNGALTACHMK
jgi:hypothetical protein